MSQHIVGVHQLRADVSRDVWMNVDTTQFTVGVWFSTHFKPTRLLQRDATFMVIQFDSVRVMEEWMEVNAKHWPVITTIGGQNG